MGIQTVIVKTCDRCGSNIHGEDDIHCEAGDLHIKWEGHTSGKCYDGSWGGVNLKGSALLCLPCLRKFQSFMKGAPALPSHPPEAP